MRKKIFIALRMAGIAGQDKLSGIFRFLGEKHDWDITLVRTAGDFTPERIREALAAHYDGFIVSIPNTEPTAARLAHTDIPTVVMDLHDSQLAMRTRNIVFIHNSATEIGRTAANHLLSIGTYRSYAFVHSPAVLEWSRDRCAAYAKTLRDNGHWCHELESAEGLRGLSRPVGVLAANDDCGYAVIQYCQAHRLRVPEDVGILGTNNDTLICENAHPKLSSIQPDFEQEGYLAAEALSQLLAATDKTEPLRLFVGVKQVVRRESTAMVSPTGKLVQKALAFIRKNALRGISVDDVAKHLNVSRRLLDLRFRELQATTIGETIIQTRLDEVKHRLRTTGESIESIALACGYENPNYLKNLFRKRYAMSMREFRRRSAS